jgi:hypothetical protein
MKLQQVEYTSIRKFRLTTSHVLLVSQIILLSILGINVLLDFQITGILVIILIACIGTPIFTMIIGREEFYPVNFKKIRDINLTDNGIKIDEELFEFKFMKDLLFDVRDFKGKKLRTPALLWHAGPSISQGVNNLISFQYKDDEYKVRFELESEKELTKLGEYISNLYRKEITIVEKYDTLNSYGLKHLNFKEIQEFKNEYCS